MTRKSDKQKKGEVTIRVRPPDIRTAVFELVGTAPYVQNRFAAKEMLRDKHEAGEQRGKKAPKPPKDFNKLYEAAKHVSQDGWLGIPASGFRAALISACRLVGFHMTMAKMTVFVLADGIDREDGTPLVRISGVPKRFDSVVRNDNGAPDVRPRPIWDKWSCTLRIQYDAGQFTFDDVTNLLVRVGMQVGIGEGRPDSKNSAGMGWGTFRIDNGPLSGKGKSRGRGRRN